MSSPFSSLSLSDLIEKLNEIGASRPDLLSKPVSIPLSNPAIGSRQFTQVVSVSAGFDWESGLVILNTADPFLLRTKERPEPVEVAEVSLQDHTGTKVHLIRHKRSVRQNLRIQIKEGDGLFICK